MNALALVLAVIAAASAKPYAFTEVAPLTSTAAIYPYSMWGAHYPMTYSAIHAYSPAVVSHAAPAVVAHAAPTVLAHAAPAVVAAPAVAAYAAPAVVAAPAVGLKTQYHSQDYFGQAAYGHAEPHQAHSAVQDAAGNKVGSFSFVKPDGHVHRTDYVADSLGYRVASNDLPVATPFVQEMPRPVADTPEVMAAKMAHFAEFEKVKSRSRRDLYFPASTSPLVHAPVVHTPFVHALPVAYSSYHHIPVVTPSGHLADTPEVTAAKIAHFAEHAKAQARGKRAIIAPAYSTYHAAATPVVTSHIAATPYVSTYSHPFSTYMPHHYNTHYVY